MQKNMALFDLNGTLINFSDVQICIIIINFFKDSLPGSNLNSTKLEKTI